MRCIHGHLYLRVQVRFLFCLIGAVSEFWTFCIIWFSGLGSSSILAGTILQALVCLMGKRYDMTSLVHAVLQVEQIFTTGEQSLPLNLFHLLLFNLTYDGGGDLRRRWRMARYAAWISRSYCGTFLFDAFMHVFVLFLDNVGGFVPGIKLCESPASLPLTVCIPLFLHSESAICFLNPPRAYFVRCRSPGLQLP